MFDAHLHLRDGEMLELVAPYSTGRCIIMPNRPEILTRIEALEYHDMIVKANPKIEPLMMLKMHKGIKLPERDKIVGVKIYPQGVTTGSENGVTVEEMTSVEMHRVYAEMVKRRLVLSIHAEMPGTFCMDRESYMLVEIEKIVKSHPDLKVVIEHISDVVSVGWIKRQRPGVAATITVHHLLLTLDDVIGGGDIGKEYRLHKNHYCAPIAKWPADRTALREAAMSGNPRFFLGTDSAPHTHDGKNDGCAGIFTAPVAMSALYALFFSMEKRVDFSLLSMSTVLNSTD